MQVEVKIIFGSQQEFDYVCNSLAGSYISEEIHENYFLDTPDNALRGRGAHLRLRFVDEKACTLTLKEHATYEGGTSTRWSKDATLAVEEGKSIVTDPISLLSYDNPVVQTLVSHFSPSSLRHVGKFSTTRKLHRWTDCKSQSGLTIRMDHSIFPFGDRYEMEVTDITVPVHDVVDEISASLDSLGVSYAMAHESKLEAFLNGSKAALSKSHMVQDAKFVLKNRTDFDALVSKLSHSFLTKEEQTNYFFDGEHRELFEKGAHLRVRSLNGTFVALIKEHQGISDGSSVYWGQQIEISREIFDDMIRSPTSFLSKNTPLSQALKDKFGIKNLRFVGCFTNERYVYNWSAARSQTGLTLHVDRTIYPFGERYEVEVPDVTVPTVDVIDELEQSLAALGIEGHAGSKSKFTVFCEGSCVGEA